MIDFDEVLTYPAEVEKWVRDRENLFLERVPIESYEFDYEIIHKLQDVRLGYRNDFIKLLEKYQEEEFTGWHNSRIEDMKLFQKQGIMTFGNNLIEGVKRLDHLLNRIKIDDVSHTAIIDEAKYYWNRDEENRTDSVHFFLTKEQTKDPQAMVFAANLGGEITDWAIKGAIGNEAYRNEPYKRLWIWGIPCRVKFKAKLKEMRESTQEHLLREIVFYFAMKDIYGLDYTPEDTGTKKGGVSANCIIQIEEIECFQKVMSQYADYENFYE